LSIDQVASFLLVPPINLLLLALAGFVMLSARCRRARWVLGTGLGGLLLLALPAVATTLLSSLNVGNVAVHANEPPSAIVILSGDIHHLDGSFPRAGVGALTIERLRAGAALYRGTHLPVLVTGGMVGGEPPAVAELMEQSLKEDFAVPTRWVEKNSHTTWENAEFSAAILRPEGIRSIYLVTHAWHMRRALIAFAHFGIAATPAPVPPDEPKRMRVSGLIPDVSAWQTSYYAIHEWIGCAWYELRAQRW
jgi:uncharacterized SAM-binding protein YcdF (DUF218 family)